jgi:hypothetical protein
MQTVKDEYTLINLWCRPLARTDYSFDEIREERIKKPNSATGTIIASLERAELDRGSGVLPSQSHASGILRLSEEDIEIAEARTRLERKEDLSSLPRFRRLKAKIDNKVFDYSEIEREKIEEEIQNIVNKDGYYDEIEPVDADDEIEETRRINPAAVLVIGLIIALSTFLYVYIRIKF